MRLRRVGLAVAALLLGTAAGERLPLRSAFAGADPSALFADGALWLYPTSDGTHLDAWSSRDFTHWRDRATLLRREDIGWLEPGRQLWAPHMQAANGRYYLYYAVGPQQPLPSRIGVAVCATEAGPCRDSGRPLIDGADAGTVSARRAPCADGMAPTGDGRFHFEAIDPMVFVDPASGRRLLYAGGSNGATLRIWELAPDLVTAVRELPVDQPPCFTEGVWMHERNGTYYLSYSSGHWDREDYSVRYATASTPLGPWTYRGVILHADARFKGPGHHAFVRDPRSGEWLIAYHRWEHERGDGPYHDRRHVALARVRYRPDGSIAPIDMERDR